MTSQTNPATFLFGAFRSVQTTVAVIVALLQKTICHPRVNCPSKFCSERTTQLFKSIPGEKALDWVLVKIRVNEPLLFRTQSIGRVTNYLRHNRIPSNSVRRELSDENEASSLSWEDRLTRHRISNVLCVYILPPFFSILRMWDKTYFHLPSLKKCADLKIVYLCKNKVNS